MQGKPLGFVAQIAKEDVCTLRNAFSPYKLPNSMDHFVNYKIT